MKKVQHTEKSEISHMSDKPAATGKTIKLKRKVPIAMYAGSLVEQSFTEGQVDSKRNERGGLIWEINGKDDFKVRPFDIKTPKPFVTVNIKEDGTLPDVDVPKHARLRLVARHAITLKQLQDVKNEAVKRWSPHSIVDIEDKKVTSLDIEDNYSKESLRDINVQEELISSFLINKGVTSNSLIEKVFEINKDIEEQIGQEEALQRGADWNIVGFEWSNLFNYGEGNTLDLSKLEGLVGVFGKSYSGKSSIVDSMLYCLFNKTAKSSTNIVNYINQRKKESYAKITFKAGESLYSVKRTAKKNGSGTKARGDVEFLRDGEEQNGQTRMETDENIRKVIGTLDDFLLSGMIPQFGSLSFINEGSTKRREILSRYLDLDIFEKKYAIAKQYTTDLRGAIRVASKNTDFDEQIKEANERKERSKSSTSVYEGNVSEIEIELRSIEEEIRAIDLKLGDAVDVGDIDITKVHMDTEDVLEQLATNRSALAAQEYKIHSLEDDIEQYERTLNTTYKGSETVKSIYAGVAKKLHSMNSRLKDSKRELETLNRATDLLAGVPCGDKFPTCRFISSAIKSKAKLPEERQRYRRLEKEVQFLEHAKQKLEKALAPVVSMTRDMTVAEIDLADVLKKNKRAKENEDYLKERYLGLKKLQQDYDKNEEQIKLVKERKRINSRRDFALSQLKRARGRHQESLMEEGRLEGKISHLQAEKQNHLNRLEKYEAYELYLKCMHSSGISFDILKKRHMSPRLVTTGSGAEQSLAAIVITLALRSVSTLPKSDIFILDEPVGSLDSEMRIGFLKLLDFVKTQARVTFLITHIDELKDFVDAQLDLHKIDGNAKLEA
jgi:DNA repair exonuclease SbcCD ATPase subunit